MSYHQPYSTTDELAEIEMYTGNSSTVPSSQDKVNVNAAQGPRRGSSIFGEPSAMKPTGPYGGPAYLSTSGEELLVDFPDGNSDDEYASGGDYEPSHQQIHASKFRQYDSDTDDENVVQDGKTEISGPTSRMGEAGRIAQLMKESSELPGGKNHRPLVGGFAAAAYEAARDLHYSSSGKDPKAVPRDRPAPPSI